jgi:hypothetical protein
MVKARRSLLACVLSCNLLNNVSLIRDVQFDACGAVGKQARHVLRQVRPGVKIAAGQGLIPFVDLSAAGDADADTWHCSAW